MRMGLTAALFAACASLGFAAAPSRSDALAAIAVLEKSVTGPEAAAAAKTIVTYAQVSEDVMVNLGPDEIPWVGEKWGLDKERELACQSILLAAFVAGDVRSQIKNDRAEDDTYSGWVFAISIYNKLRAKEAFRSPSIEALSKMEVDGSLLRHAKEIQSREEQDPAQSERKPQA